MTMVAEPKKKTKATPKVETFETVVEDATLRLEAVVEPQVNPPVPGDADYDWFQHYPDEDVFVFTAGDGRTVGLAAMGPKRRPKPGVLRKLRLRPPTEQMWFIIERVASDAALDVSDDFDEEDYADMFQQWSEWSNTTAGESSRSSTS